MARRTADQGNSLPVTSSMHRAFTSSSPTPSSVALVRLHCVIIHQRSFCITRSFAKHDDLRPSRCSQFFKMPNSCTIHRDALGLFNVSNFSAFPSVTRPSVFPLLPTLTSCATFLLFVRILTVPLGALPCHRTCFSFPSTITYIYCYRRMRFSIHRVCHTSECLSNPTTIAPLSVSWSPKMCANVFTVAV